MAEEDSTTTEATLERTPTWAVATVCFVLILVSIIIEHLLHRLAKFLNKRRKKSLLEALDKIKSELMLLGFVSLFLTISEKTIANICIPESVGHTFLPCGTQMSTDVEEEAKCAQQDKVSLLSRNGVRQLQYLIFVLAVSHVFSCVLTFGFGIAKMMRWEAWEAETRTLDYQFSNEKVSDKTVNLTGGQNCEPNWCILSNALPVRSLIGSRFQIETMTCPLCGLREESIEHLFLTCDLASHVWRSSPWGIYPVCDNGIRMWDWVKFIWSLKDRGIRAEEVFLYASIVVDTIWRTRNEVVHNDCLPDVKRCIDSVCYSFADIHPTILPDHDQIRREFWAPPPQDWIKLNCDVRVGLESMCIAVVARNHLSEVIRVHSTQLDFSDALCGEAAACCLAVSVALEMGSKFVIVESDSRLVINALNGKESHWALENYVSFCSKSSPSFISCNFINVSRSCNFVAHNVAKWAFTHHLNGSISVPSLPENLFCNDHEV